MASVPTLSFLNWLADESATCPAGVLQQVWRHALAADDLKRLAKIAHHPALTVDLERAVARAAAPSVRLAYLARPGLDPELGAALLVGETRSAVLNGLLGEDLAPWLREHGYRQFLLAPTVWTAMAVLAHDDLTDPVREVVTITLLPRVASLTAPQLQRFLHHMPVALGAGLRADLLQALVPLLLAERVRPPVISALLDGPLDTDRLARIAQPLLYQLRQLLNRSESRGGWAELIRVLLYRSNLPIALVEESQGLLAHRNAQRVGLGGIRIPTGVCVGDRSQTCLRTTADADFIAEALASLHPDDLIDILHNDRLTLTQVHAQCQLVPLTVSALKQLTAAPVQVRRLLLQLAPVLVLTVHGWQWFPDIGPTQRSLIRAMFGPSREVWTNSPLGLFMDLHAVDPFLPAQCAALPADVVRRHLFHERPAEADTTQSLATILSDQIQLTLGGDALAWDTFFTLLEEFTGTIGELLDLSVTLTAPGG